MQPLLQSFPARDAPLILKTRPFFYFSVRQPQRRAGLLSQDSVTCSWSTSLSSQNLLIASHTFKPLVSLLPPLLSAWSASFHCTICHKPSNNEIHNCAKMFLQVTKRRSPHKLILMRSFITVAVKFHGWWFRNAAQVCGRFAFCPLERQTSNINLHSQCDFMINLLIFSDRPNSGWLMNSLSLLLNYSTSKHI